MWASLVQRYYLGRGSRDSRYKRERSEEGSRQQRVKTPPPSFFPGYLSFLLLLDLVPLLVLRRERERERAADAFSSRSRRPRRRRYNITSPPLGARPSLFLFRRSFLRAFSALLSRALLRPTPPPFRWRPAPFPLDQPGRLFITGLAFILDLHNLNTEARLASSININIVFLFFMPRPSSFIYARNRATVSS